MNDRYQLRWAGVHWADTGFVLISSETVLAETNSKEAAIAAANLLWDSSEDRLFFLPWQARILKLDENGYGWRELKFPRK